MNAIRLMALPNGWAMTQVGHVCCNLQYGYTASARSESCGPRFLRITDIQDGQVQWSSVPYCIIPEEQVQKYSLHDGDILFARTGGTVGKSFIINSIPETSVFASYLIRLTPHSSIKSRFLHYFFQSLSYWEQISLKKGGLQGNVNATTLSSLQLPLCPVNEQGRIVAKIEELFSELDKGVESLTAAREQLKVYRQAVLKHAFEGKLTADWRAMNPDRLETPEILLSRIHSEREARYTTALDKWQHATIEWDAQGNIGDRPTRPRKPKNLQADPNEPQLKPNVSADWAIAYLGNLDAEIFDGPFGSNLKTDDYVEYGVRVIRLENVGRGRFIDEKLSFVSEEKYETIQNHTVVAGDIIFSSFIIDAIRSAIVPSSITFAVNKADCFGIRIRGQVATAFVQHFLQSRNTFKQLEGMIHGVGRPRVNTTQLSQVALPLCSFEEQSQILRLLDRSTSEIDGLEATIATALIQITCLRQSILEKAFSGQLVPQDANDEPASVLLERICAEKQQDTSGPKNSKQREKEMVS